MQQDHDIHWTALGVLFTALAWLGSVITVATKWGSVTERQDAQAGKIEMIEKRVSAQSREIDGLRDGASRIEVLIGERFKRISEDLAELKQMIREEHNHNHGGG